MNKKVIEMNINDFVTVRLSSEGVRTYEDYFSTLAKRLGRRKEDIYIKLDRRRGGRVEFPLWRLMEIFGPKIYHGGPIFFLNSTVRIVQK
ncbi:MAG: hypothetical protein AAB581_00530 [Patescibacteria group bacterium]